jgi:hypothetical protein
MSTIWTLTNELRDIAAEGRAHAERVANDNNLTHEGKGRTFSNWGEQQRWPDRIADVEQRVDTSLRAVEDRAAKARSKATGTASTAEQTLAELRWMRRGDSIRAALGDRGRAAETVAELVANANAADLEILEQEIGTFYAGRENMAHTAAAVRDAIEAGLRERSPEYSRAADEADQADAVRSAVARLASGARLATEELHPAEGHLWAKLQADVDGLGGIVNEAA